MIWGDEQLMVAPDGTDLVAVCRDDARSGQKVRRGDVIGRVGWPCFSTGPHLHWEARVRGEATNPLRWVGRR